jgi:hypothetical protein
MKKIIVLFLVTILLISAGCGAPDVIGIRGKVTNITSGEKSIVMLVEGSIDKDTTLDKANVTVDDKSSVFVRSDGKDKAADKSDIKQGSTVEVIFEGAVAESYPVQGRAKKVIIISGE